MGLLSTLGGLFVNKAKKEIAGRIVGDSGGDGGGGGGGYVSGEKTQQNTDAVARSSDKHFSAGIISKNINNPNASDFSGSGKIAIVSAVAIFGLYLFLRGRR